MVLVVKSSHFFTLFTNKNCPVMTTPKDYFHSPSLSDPSPSWLLSTTESYNQNDDQLSEISVPLLNTHHVNFTSTPTHTITDDWEAMSEDLSRLSEPKRATSEISSFIGQSDADEAITPEHGDRQHLDLRRLTPGLLCRVFDFLLGQIDPASKLPNNAYYWNIVKERVHYESEHDSLLLLYSLIPPKENVISLYHLIRVNNWEGREIFTQASHVGVEEERFWVDYWKKTYVHYEKILFLFRCINYKNITLAMGKIQWYEREQLANMQRLIVAYELGMIDDLRVGETVEQFDDEVEAIPDTTNFYSAQYLEDLFLKKLQRLDLTKRNDEYFISSKGKDEGQRSLIDLALYKLFQLSLKMFRDFDMDFKDLALPNNFRNSHVKFEMDIYTEHTRKLGFCMDFNSSYQFEVDTEEENEEIIENLSNYIVLDVRDVTNFSKFLNFELPRSVMFLNFSSSIPYNYDLGESKFPNVRFMRINLEGTSNYSDIYDSNDYCGSPVFQYGETINNFLCEMLTRERFPNLVHLVLKGVHNLQVFQDCNILPQLWFLELLVSEVNSFWTDAQCIPSLSHVLKQTEQLKQLTLNVNLDVRQFSGVDYEKLQQIYALGIEYNVSVSVGRSSIAKYCKYSFKTVY